MRRATPVAALIAFGLLSLVALRPAKAEIVAGDPDRPTLMQIAEDGTRSELPLVRGAMHVEVRGPIAQVQLVQSFANPSDVPIEAVYVFPMPDQAAVGAMTMKVGARTLRAEIRTRDEARTIYETAKAEGKATALLEQERPNVFTQSVANILPGEQIDVALTYDLLLEPVDDRYELVLPTVVGPRYIPSLEQVPDAAAISPPVMEPGELSGNVLDVDLDVDAAMPIVSIDSPTHPIVARKIDRSQYHVTLASGDAVANKDFVLRWEVEVSSPALAVLANKDADASLGHLALIIQPPPAAPEEAGPRELVFVVDTSGSMEGEPLALAKKAMRFALERLGPDDTFRILNFSDEVSGFEGGDSNAATRQNVRRAVSFVNGMVGAGGTEMLAGVKAALGGELEAGRSRYVSFMTDGYIGNDDEVIAAVQKAIDQRTFLFSFGVGSSVNRYVLDEIAKEGRGVAHYLLLDELPGPQIEEFFAQMATPVLADLKVEWDGLDVVDTAPAAIRHLFAGQPVVISGRYAKGGEATVKVSGRRGGKAVTLQIPVTLPDDGGDGSVIARLWARRRIAELSSQMLDGEHGDGATEITTIALAHSLMSAYTSFVAVEERPRTDGDPQRVDVPVELPEGVTLDAVDGSQLVLGQTYSFEDVLGSAAGSQGETITITDSAPIIDSASTVQGTTLYFGASSNENGYIIDGINTIGAAEADKAWRGSIDISLGVGLGSDGPAGAYSASVERRLIARLAIGATATVFDRSDAATMVSLLGTIARWALGGTLDLRLGAGAAFTAAGDLGLAWQARLALPLPLGDLVHPELELRFDGARSAGTSILGTVLGVGVRF